MAGQKSHGLAKIFTSKQAKLDRRFAASAALSAATNPSDMAVMECRLVREYLKFEKNWAMREEERISCADARKVRWILIYSMLQTLISVTRAPKEVRDTEDVEYPLCCQIAGTPPWNIGAKSQAVDISHAHTDTKLPKSVITIEPDIDYFTPNPASSLAIDAQHGVLLPHKVSFSDGLCLQAPQPQKPGFCVLLNGYRLNTNTTRSDSDPSTPSSSEREGSSAWESNSDEDIMEHASVDGSASFYGDDEDTKPSELPTASDYLRKPSACSFQQGDFNPEVDRYVLS